MRSLRAALSFLTIVPVGGVHEAPSRGALVAFPIVGLLVGLLWVLVSWAGLSLWSGLIAAAIVLVADAILTGGLHLDAVGDVADGLGSRRRGAEMLAVMRDPRLGGVGVAAVVLVLITRFAFVAEILGQDGWLLIVPPTVARAAMVRGVALLPSGEGSLATELRTAADAGVQLLTVTVAAVVVAGVGGAVGSLVPTLVAMVLGLLVADLAVRSWTRWIGSPSGDVAGACGVLAELAALAVLAA